MTVRLVLGTMIGVATLVGGFAWYVIVGHGRGVGVDSPTQAPAVAQAAPSQLTQLEAPEAVQATRVLESAPPATSKLADTKPVPPPHPPDLAAHPQEPVHRTEARKLNRPDWTPLPAAAFEREFEMRYSGMAREDLEYHYTTLRDVLDASAALNDDEPAKLTASEFAVLEREVDQLKLRAFP